MPELIATDQTMMAEEYRWAAYNGAMAALFAERDQYPLDSADRDAVVAKIMALWVSEPGA
jgi:hypothetical protein